MPHRLTALLPLLALGVLAARAESPEKSAPPAPQANAAGAPARAPDPLRAHLAAKLKSAPLEYLAHRNQYFIESEVNKVPARLQVDSGAGRTTLALDSLAKFGLDSVAAGESAGIAGRVARRQVDKVPMSIGKGIVQVPAINLPVVRMAEQSTDGLVGINLLASCGAIIDHRDHRIYFAFRKPVETAAMAKAAGLREITLARAGSQNILEGTIKGRPVRLLIDTGAQETVLDGDFARQIGLPVIPCTTVARGVGAKSQPAAIASLSGLEISGLHFDRVPVLVMPLAPTKVGKARDYDGILGAGVLFATEAVFDIGKERLYLADKAADLREYTALGAELFASDAALKQAWQTAAWVGSATLVNLRVEPNPARADGRVAVCATLSIRETLKGAPAPGISEKTLTLLLPDSADPTLTAARLIGSARNKLLFLPTPLAEPTPAAPYAEIIHKDGELPRDQLKRAGLIDAPAKPTP